MRFDADGTVVTGFDYVITNLGSKECVFHFSLLPVLGWNVMPDVASQVEQSTRLVQRKSHAKLAVTAREHTFTGSDVFDGKAAKAGSIEIRGLRQCRQRYPAVVVLSAEHLVVGHYHSNG